MLKLLSLYRVKNNERSNEIINSELEFYFTIAMQIWSLTPLLQFRYGVKLHYCNADMEFNSTIAMQKGC